MYEIHLHITVSIPAVKQALIPVLLVQLGQIGLGWVWSDQDRLDWLRLDQVSRTESEYVRFATKYVHFTVL